MQSWKNRCETSEQGHEFRSALIESGLVGFEVTKECLTLDDSLHKEVLGWMPTKTFWESGEGCLLHSIAQFSL